MKRSPVKTVGHGRAPLPDVFPGAFFVVTYEREDASYTLHLDDEAHSTFDLGDQDEAIRAVFTSRGYPHSRVCDLLDRAREFGTAQYIPSGMDHVEDRVIQILPREARTPVLNVFADPSHGWNHL